MICEMLMRHLSDVGAWCSGTWQDAQEAKALYWVDEPIPVVLKRLPRRMVRERLLLQVGVEDIGGRQVATVVYEGSTVHREGGRPMPLSTPDSSFYLTWISRRVLRPSDAILVAGVADSRGVLWGAGPSSVRQGGAGACHPLHPLHRTDALGPRLPGQSSLSHRVSHYLISRTVEYAQSLCFLNAP